MLRKVKIYLALITLLGIASIITLIWAIFMLSPYQTPVTALSIFYLAVLGLTFSLTTLLGFFTRRKLGAPEFTLFYFKRSVRQGLLIGLFCTIAIGLQSVRLFNWLNSVLLLGALIFLEFYFLTNEKQTIQN